MAVRPSARAIATLFLTTQDTAEPVAGVEVLLLFSEQPGGAYRPVGRGTTGPQGAAQVPFSVPDRPGAYYYRCGFNGNAQLEPDQSPDFRIDVALPRA